MTADERRPAMVRKVTDLEGSAGCRFDDVFYRRAAGHGSTRDGGKDRGPAMEQGRYIDAREARAVASWLDDAVARLVQALDPERITLFGSWARGTATRRSDLDLCVIWATDRPPLDRMGHVLQLLRDAPRPVEPIVYTPDEWERLRASPFVRRIEEEGKVLYERGTVTA